MNVRDPATWPKKPALYYLRISERHPTVHAFDNSRVSLCNAVVLERKGRGAVPTEGYTRLCSNCIGALKSWGYLSRSEVVDYT